MVKDKYNKDKNIHYYIQPLPPTHYFRDDNRVCFYLALVGKTNIAKTAMEHDATNTSLPNK